MSEVTPSKVFNKLVSFVMKNAYKNPRVREDMIRHRGKNALMVVDGVGAYFFWLDPQGRLQVMRPSEMKKYGIKPLVVIRMSGQTFLRIFFKKSSAYREYLHGNLEFMGDNWFHHSQIIMRIFDEARKAMGI